MLRLTTWVILSISIYPKIAYGKDVKWVPITLSEQLKRVVANCLPRSAKCEEEGNFRFTLVKSSDTYAKGLVRDASGVGQETESAYFVKQDGQWILLDLGSGVNPSDLGVPRGFW